MALLTQLENKRSLKIYQPDRCKSYKLESQYYFEQDVDDYYIDRFNRLYPIFSRAIYARRNTNVIIAENVYEYSIIDTELGVLFYYIVQKPSREENEQYKLVSREVKDEIENEKELLNLDHEKYKILVINRKNYIVYDNLTLHIQYKERYNKIITGFTILDLCYLEDKIVMLDDAYNIQIYDLREMKLTSGFRAIAPSQSIVSLKELNLVCLNTDDGLIVIDVKYRNIIRKKNKAEIKFEYRNMEFIDHRTLLLTGDGVWELCLVDGSFYVVIEPKSNCSYKYFKESQGYILNIEYAGTGSSQCNCYQTMLSMKIEMRRENFRLSTEIQELKEEIRKMKKSNK